MPAAGTPTDIRMVARITMPTPGVPGVPIDAPMAVTSISRTPVAPISMPKTWARKIAAVAW